VTERKLEIGDLFAEDLLNGESNGWASLHGTVSCYHSERPV